MKPLHILLSLGYLLALASCATPPSGSQNSGSSSQSVSGGEIQTSAEETNLALLLEQASLASSPQTERYLLDAARQLIRLNRFDEAQDILGTLIIEPLDLTLAAEILLERGQLFIISNQASLAVRTLSNPRLDALPQLSNSLQLSIRLARSQAYLNDRNYLESTKERIYADKLLPNSALAQNHERIWNSLVSLPAVRLRALARDELNFEFQGWYELGVIGKAYQYNLDRQLVELERWRQSRTRHPASLYLPQVLQLVESMAQERPDSIALLLPMDTSAGRIVRDGFMSAYYNVQNIGGQVPSLRFYDTSRAADITALHRRAIDEGAAMVIGPLLKQNVARLQQREDLEVITLALNNIDGVRPRSDLLYQFALSPENEATQIAYKAWNDGHRYVAILSPEDELINDSYQRKRERFIQEWLTLGGQIVAQETFRDDYISTIETLLNLSDSEYRKESLSELIGEPLEFTQRRRQDIDFIFLIAQPEVARQINPRLSYLYAGDIPVYATQDIYSGITSPLEDVDLNGILFSDSPWILSNNDDLKEETQDLFPQTTARNLRLQAFGIDAFRLYPRLKQLNTVAGTQIYGATGILTLGENKNINRELSWAQINQGFATAVDADE